MRCASQSDWGQLVQRAITYISGMATEQTLAASLERIRAVAGVIIGAVQPDVSGAAASSNQLTTGEIMETAGAGGQTAEA